MLGNRVFWLLAVAVAVICLAACGGDDDSPTTSGSPTSIGSETLILPPFEGPDRPAAEPPRRNYREDSEWELPSPASLPTPAPSLDDAALRLTAPRCSPEFETLSRPEEGFQICYPEEWTVAGQGYVNSANEDPWFAVGIFNFPEGETKDELAHVSIYVTPPFARPFRYTIDCPGPVYRVELAGQPAAACTSFTTTAAESRIVAYHIPTADFDYFIVVTVYDRSADGSGTPSGASELPFAVALRIAGTFSLIEPTSAVSPSPTPVPITVITTPLPTLTAPPTSAPPIPTLGATP